jgi:serine/threonine protein kinase
VVAIKKFKSRIDGDGPEVAAVRKTAMREVKLLRTLHHAHIVTLLDVFRQGGKLYLCFEYLEKTGEHRLLVQAWAAHVQFAAQHAAGRLGAMTNVHDNFQD